MTDESPVEEQARALAVAFDLPYIVRSAPADVPIGGTTTSAAAAVGVPAAIADVGGRGLLEEEAAQRLLAGETLRIGFGLATKRTGPRRGRALSVTTEGCAYGASASLQVK